MWICKLFGHDIVQDKVKQIVTDDTGKVVETRTKLTYTCKRCMANVMIHDDTISPVVE